MSRRDRNTDGSTVDIAQDSVPDGHESDLAKEVNRLGPRLIHYLFSAAKTLQVHDMNNRAAQRILSDLADALQELAKVDDRMSLRVSADFLLINDVRVTVDPQNYGPFLYLMEEMKKREVEGIGFQPDITAEELGRFITLFFKSYPDGATFDQLVEGLATEQIEKVALVQWVERERKLEEVMEVKEGIREESNQVFFSNRRSYGGGP